MAMKLFMLLRLLELWSPLNNQASRFLMTFSKIQSPSNLMRKSWIFLMPIKTLLISVTIYITICAYLVMLAERSNILCNYDYHQVDVCYDYDGVTEVTTQSVSYKDAIWMLLITFLTVGYGEYYPVTFVGRVVAILTVIIG